MTLDDDAFQWAVRAVNVADLPPDSPLIARLLEEYLSRRTLAPPLKLYKWCAARAGLDRGRLFPSFVCPSVHFVVCIGDLGGQGSIDPFPVRPGQPH